MILILYIIKLQETSSLKQLYSLRQYYQLTVYEDQPDFKEYLPIKRGEQDNLLRICKSNIERISKIDTPYFDGEKYLEWFIERYRNEHIRSIKDIGEDFTLENLRTRKQNVVYLCLDESMGQRFDTKDICNID